MQLRSPSGLAALLMVLALCTSVDAYAQGRHDDAEKAEQHYLSAVQLLGQGRYREALDEFDAAIAKSPEAIFYCNRAVALIKLEEMDEALKSVRTCRSTFVGDEAELAQIDAQAKGLAAYVENAAPTARNVAERIALGPLNAAPVTPPSEGWGLTDYGLITMGVGAALLASAATLDFLSADLKDEFILESQGGSGTSQARYDELKSDLEGRRTTFLALSITGATLAAVGAGLVTWDFVTTDAEVRVEPDGSGATATLRFRW